MAISHIHRWRCRTCESFEPPSIAFLQKRKNAHILRKKMCTSMLSVRCCWQFGLRLYPEKFVRVRSHTNVRHTKRIPWRMYHFHTQVLSTLRGYGLRLHYFRDGNRPISSVSPQVDPLTAWQAGRCQNAPQRDIKRKRHVL